ncbi:MAG TPA: hypothetical protein VMW72_27345 [Sedimentisphaerales bacterium]|nr:hypothetical protein [Sedimentisphaerales bacterium]
MLSKHYSHWKNDHTVARHLSTALVKNYPELKTEPNDQNESRLIRWVNAVELLGMTRDKDMVSLLRPFLGCKVTVRTYKDDALLPRGVVPVPERACDTAYNAIMTLLEQENQKLKLRPGLLGRGQVCKDPDDVREVLRKRDELIRALDVKLTDITSERGPALHTAQPAQLRLDETWITCVDAKRHFGFQYPKKWKLTTGDNLSTHYDTSFVSLNSFGKEKFWLFDWSRRPQPEPVSSKLPPGSVYLEV